MLLVYGLTKIDQSEGVFEADRSSSNRRMNISWKTVI